MAWAWTWGPGDCQWQLQLPLKIDTNHHTATLQVVDPCWNVCLFARLSPFLGHPNRFPVTREKSPLLTAVALHWLKVQVNHTISIKFSCPK